jgi:hypothetical protein
MIWKKVFIQDFDQVGRVRYMAGANIETVEVQTPDGPKVINVLEKGYKIISLVMAILQLILKFFGK